MLRIIMGFHHLHRFVDAAAIPPNCVLFFDVDFSRVELWDRLQIVDFEGICRARKSEDSVWFFHEHFLLGTFLRVPVLTPFGSCKARLRPLVFLSCSVCGLLRFRLAPSIARLAAHKI